MNQGKLREDIANLLHDDLLAAACETERRAFETELDDLCEVAGQHAERLEVLNDAFYAYLNAYAERAFVIGLEVGRDVRRLIFEPEPKS